MQNILEWEEKKIAISSEKAQKIKKILDNNSRKIILHQRKRSAALK